VFVFTKLYIFLKPNIRTTFIRPGKFRLIPNLCINSYLQTNIKRIKYDNIVTGLSD